MDAITELRLAADAKGKESKALSQAYSTTLTALAPANIILVVGAALLSLAAGASILIDSELITKTSSGLLAFASGALTIIHSKLGCEDYQAECKQLLSFHRGKAEDYGNLKFIEEADEFRRRFLALNDEVATTMKTSSALPFEWATRGKALSSRA